MSNLICFNVDQLLVYGYVRPFCDYNVIISIIYQYYYEIDITKLLKEISLRPNRLLQYAKAAETAERYQDMILFMKQFVCYKINNNQSLDVEERSLLSVAYKNVVGEKRAAWRTLNGGFVNAFLEQEIIEKYKILVENEIEEYCNDIIDLLNEYLCKYSETMAAEEEYFYFRLRSNCYVHLTEITRYDIKCKEMQTKHVEKMAILMETLPPTHPTRLQLALSICVHYYEILMEPEKACDLAKKTFDEALENLDTLNDESYKDSTLIMQLLRDNLTLWTSTIEDDDTQ